MSSTEQVEHVKITRQTQWFGVAAFTIIALVAMTNNFNDNISDETKEVKWAVSAVSIALTFSSVAVIANLFLKDKFVGTIMETGMVRRFTLSFVWHLLFGHLSNV
jgi:hypothetical protein